MARCRNSPLESVIQSRIIDKYTRAGWVCVRLIQTNMNGIPDLLLLRNGVAKFVEVKRKGCKPRPLQEYRIKQLRDEGFEVFVIDNDACISTDTEAQRGDVGD